MSDSFCPFDLTILPEYSPSLELIRNFRGKDIVDMRFFGIVSLFKLSPGKVFDVIEKPVFGRHNNYPFFLRSLLKPIQVSIMADFNTKDFYNFSDKEIAVMQASHCGEKEHTELVLSILNKAGLKEKNLLCPAIAPLSPDGIAKNESARRIHNNCSAKHAMMLCVSKQLNYPIDDYTSPSHPIQKLILKKIGELCDIKDTKNLPQTFDGCTVPVWALSFKSIAKAFFRLYMDEKYRFLKDAYVKYPYIIGGKDALGPRQDTHFMQLNPDLILKTGAGGFLSIYNDKKREFLLIKMAQDNNIQRNLLAAKLLAGLDWIKPASIKEFGFNFYNEKGDIAGRYEIVKTHLYQGF